MSYIYFDCFSGFDVQLALGALIDMSKDTQVAQKAVGALIKDALIYTEETKRQSMEGTLAYLDFCVTEEKPINEIIDVSDLSDEMKSKLKRWYKLKSDGRHYHFYDEINDLLFCAASLALIENSGAEKVYFSAIYQGKGVIAGENNITVIPSPHTELLTKMANILVTPANIDKEILTPGGIAFLYVLNAEYMSPKAHNVIKSGYGAGAEDLPIANVARCVLADDYEKELGLNIESLMSDIYTEFGAVGQI